jgi:hypothetical protein
MTRVIAFLLLIWEFTKFARPVLTRFGGLLGKISGGVKYLFRSPIAYWLLVLEAPLEFLLKVFFNVDGPVSSLINYWVHTILNVVLHYTIHQDLQSMVNLLPANLLNYCCYIGLSAGLQLTYSGIIAGMGVIIGLQVTMIGLRIKAWLATRAILKGRGQYFK